MTNTKKLDTVRNMSNYGNSIKGSLKKYFDTALQDLDVEKSDIYSEDIALINAKIAMLLKTGKKAPTQSDLDRLSGLLVVVESEMETMKPILMRNTDQTTVPDEYLLTLSALVRAMTFIKNMKLSEESWKEIRELQEQKRKYIESQREHNQKRSGEKMTKAEYQKETERLYRAIITAVDDQHILDRIFGNLGVDRKRLNG